MPKPPSSDFNPFSALADLISGRIFDGPETTSSSPTSAAAAAAEEVADDDAEQPKPRKQRPAKPTSLEHVLEPVDPSPKRKRKPDAGADAVAAEEASKEGAGES